MSEAYFPINDLLRRKLQTSLVIFTLATCVALTVFLLLFSDKMGFGISLMVEDKLTAGLSAVFSPFLIFLGILIFTVGAVIVSFMVFVMISQRVRDIGLMKAVGCPNDLVFGYFMTELLIVSIIGCFLGVVFGILADFASTSLFNSLSIPIPQRPINFWIVLLVFVLSFALALVFGAKPIFDAAKVEPARALSPVHSYGLSSAYGFKIISKWSIMMRVALRSLFRRKSATIRIILCLSVIFTLLTVAVAGGIVADETTRSWVERAMDRDVVLIAHRNMTTQYNLLLSKFFKVEEESQFNYTTEQYFVPDNLPDRLRLLFGEENVETRLVLEAHLKEVQGYIIENVTQETVPVGDDREGDALVIGVEPEKVLNNWFMEGEFLEDAQSFEAVVGDTLSHKMFSVPLAQKVRLLDTYFSIKGVCLDPMNNGNVTYVPLKVLQNIAGITKPNVVMVKVDSSTNRSEAIAKIQAEAANVSSDFVVLELNEVLDRNLGFLSSLWSTVMVLPLFSLTAASMCLIAYITLAMAEQRQEFGVLRALGAKPNTVLKIVSIQSLVVLLSSFAVGIAFGVMITLLILIPEPLITICSIIKIAVWLLAALTVMLIVTLYPAFRFAKKSLIEMMAQT